MNLGSTCKKMPGWFNPLSYCFPTSPNPPKFTSPPVSSAFPSSVAPRQAATHADIMPWEAAWQNPRGKGESFDGVEVETSPCHFFYIFLLVQVGYRLDRSKPSCHQQHEQTNRTNGNWHVSSRIVSDPIRFIDFRNSPATSIHKESHVREKRKQVNSNIT